VKKEYPGEKPTEWGFVELDNSLNGGRFVCQGRGLRQITWGFAKRLASEAWVQESRQGDRTGKIIVRTGGEGSFQIKAARSQKKRRVEKERDPEQA